MMQFLFRKIVTDFQMNKRVICYLVLLLWPTTVAVAQTTFTAVRQGDIVEDLGDFTGCNWGDFDNDGDLDLFVANRGGANLLYRNRGDGTFDRHPDSVFVATIKNSRGGSWGDYDNDGDLDLFVANEGRNDLFNNNGDGSFSPITSGDILDTDRISRTASWADYDNDGDLDLFVANGERQDAADELYHNNGDGSFTRVTTSSLSDNNEPSVGHSWGDYDNDGDLDLFVAKNAHTFLSIGSDLRDALYQNDGLGSFNQAIQSDVTADSVFSFGGSWGDYDNDGDLDLFVTDALSGSNMLYENMGNGSFTRVASFGGGYSRASSWGDYDNDGDLDIFVANEYVSMNRVRHGVRNYLYQNNGDGSFSKMTHDGDLNDDGIPDVQGAGAVVSDEATSRAASWADVDNDGDLDLFVANVRSIAELQPVLQSNNLYINEGNGNHWINIRCIGTFSNRSAIGTKVRVKATIFGKSYWQLREISSQTGHSSQNSMRAAFGLGDATVIDSIKIEWPSGRDQIFTDVSVDQFMTIEEPVPFEEPAVTTTELATPAVIQIRDTVGTIASVTMEYRRAGPNPFIPIAMTNQGGLFEAAVPGASVTPNGVEYRIRATDVNGGSFSLPTRNSYSVRVEVPQGVSEGAAREHGNEQNAYRIFSFPLELDSADPADLLVDDLGEYDVTRWRFSQFNAEASSNLEFPDIQAIESGRGYWFLVSEPARVIDTGAGTSYATHEEFAIGLEPDWNLIGNPFAYPIPVGNLRLKSGNSVVLRFYRGGWNNPISNAVDAIQPFEGYAINAIAPTTDTLFVNPYLLPSVPAKPALLRRHTNTISWSVEIKAQIQGARDGDNVLGVAVGSLEGPDGLDFPEPPPIGEYVSVYFPHDDWETVSSVFCTDFRPNFDQSAVWEFDVRSNIRDQIRLTFADIEQVPKEYDLWLIDEMQNITQNLRNDNQFYLASPGVENPKRLKIIVGKSDFIENDIAGIQKVPTDYELSQNFPNPFNPVTTIRFGLPEPGRVTLKVYDVLGREVATLVDNEPHGAGYHTAVWNGRAKGGRREASGVYFVRMHAGDFTQIRKMALVY